MSVNFVKRCEINEALAARLSSELAVPIDMARLLITRGVTDSASAEEFLNPDVSYLKSPFEIKGIAEAVERIRLAIERSESVVIYGDYDCDGICAISILYNYLRDFIKKINYYVPNRHNEGYGLHNIAIDGVVASFKPDLVITVDCGITSVKEVEYIKEGGADVIVTDHHEPQGEIPNCIVVNPKVEKRGFYDYCGAGVAFKLVEALAGREKALEFIGLAAVATIADIVPLVGENRIIAKAGLDRINKNKTLASIMLKKQIGVDKATAYDIMFKAAPRINAAGRMGDATNTVSFFISNNPTQMQQVLDDVEADNKKRQALCEDTVNDIMEKLKSYDLSENYMIIMSDESWDPGILGIAAARLSEMFFRPVLLFNRNGDTLRGSARSIRKINIFECLNRFSDYFVNFGGHSAAAGVTMKTEKLTEFSKEINAYMRANFTAEQFYPDVLYDISLSYAICTFDFVDMLAKFEPTGFGNPQPVFLMENVNLKFNQIGKTNHIKHKSKDGSFEIIGFNMLGFIESANSEINLSMSLSRKSYMGRDYIQGVLKCLTVCEPKNIDDEFICLDYLLQVFLPQRELVREVKYCKTDSDIPKPEGLFGNLYVCFSTETYYSALKQLRKNDRFVLYNLKRSFTCNPYNRLILMPDNEFDFRYYKRVILLDKPFNEGYVGWLMTKTDAEIYQLGEERVNLDKIRKLRCQADEDYRTIYKVFRTKKFYNVGSFRELAAKFSAMGYNYGLLKITTAVYIMIEMGVLKMTDNFEFEAIDGVKNSLYNSLLYRQLYEI